MNIRRIPSSRQNKTNAVADIAERKITLFNANKIEYKLYKRCSYRPRYRSTAVRLFSNNKRVGCTIKFYFHDVFFFSSSLNSF